MAYETTFRVRSTQVDQLGHMNNAAFMELFEWTRWQWGEAAGFAFDRLIRERGIGPVLVHVEVSFRRELRFHENVTVTAELLSDDNGKGLILQRMLKEDGELAAEGRFTYVMIDLKKRKRVPLPDEMKATLV